MKLVDINKIEDDAEIFTTVKNGNLDLVQMLIDRGVDLNVKTGKEGITPLHAATARGYPEIVKLLLDNGADVNAKCNKGSTSLHFATRMNHEQIAIMLIDHGASVVLKKNTVGQYNIIISDKILINYIKKTTNPDKIIDIKYFLLDLKPRSTALHFLFEQEKHFVQNFDNLILQDQSNSGLLKYLMKNQCQNFIKEKGREYYVQNYNKVFLSQDQEYLTNTNINDANEFQELQINLNTLIPQNKIHIIESFEDPSFVINQQELINDHVEFDLHHVQQQQKSDVIYNTLRVNWLIKNANMLIDISRFYFQPTFAHAKTLLLDISHITSMYYGSNTNSYIMLGIAIFDDLKNAEYQEVLNKISSSVAYSSLLSLGSYQTGNIVITAYTAYVFTHNLYQLYIDCTSPDNQFKSIIAYYNLYQILVDSSLSKLFDFEPLLKKYQDKILEFKAEEQFEIKEQLITKGEFGQKLYDYIYYHKIQIKYDIILNSEKNYDNIDKIQQQNQHPIILYQDCLAQEQLNINNEKHYYCYHESKQILDHVIIRGLITEIEEM